MRDDLGDDILRPINFKELTQLLMVYEAKLAYSLRGFNYLKLQIEWQKNGKVPKSEKLKTKFFTHRNGNLTKNGTFISISEESDYSIFIESLQENLDELREIIFLSKRINWKIGPFCYSVLNAYIPILMDYFMENKLSTEFQTPNEIFYLPKNEAINFDYEIPDNVGIRELGPNDAILIDQNWLYKSRTSQVTVEDLIKLNGGLGIYERSTKELLAWVLINESYAIGRLQTIEEAKRKGYGKLLIKAFCRKIAKNDKVDIIAYINSTNTASRNLFVSLGFKEIGKCSYLKVTNEIVN